MRTAIIYESKHGTAEKVAQTISDGINNSLTDLINLGGARKTDLTQYSIIVLGTSIHAGKIGKAMSRFVKDNIITLLEKPVALFICYMNDADKDLQFSNAFPELLRNHAFASCYAGGEFKLEKMNFIERIIIKRITGIKSSVSNINYEQIDQLISRISANILIN
ncbi:flavodoxin domain-containing protein [Alkalitalea saponilacus]|uniref:Menaquinone-dependent protoporphyrinogen oxidase n=1 Tax=Alkalitalea saponilacus TaxID=889453 RepID=A0A1T5HSG5_9BACT|nr:flavodoxin domain-containing protein [Alkalitalea saponilacus]ASB47707.1 flavodoxin [Alkalitalea saponilacus]SKC23633.1 menaquinone-dependent protoporphyrinogen oxidase [Alkalitalea saponilacus]